MYRLYRGESVGKPLACASRADNELLCHGLRTNPIAQHLYGHAANARALAA
jgi:hypothetical protein